ncbi:MAG: hypothetical protein V2I31_12425 [Mariniphaga sp.]|jgi:hypothetical protein|nr:hypothetical protein [Mariniphaga sp.]
MNTTKNCCRIFPFILFLISCLIALAMWYLDEGIHSFSFLTDKHEIFNFLGTALFIAVLPIGIFYLASEKERYSENAKKLALLGFMPALMVLVFQLI